MRDKLRLGDAVDGAGRKPFTLSRRSALGGMAALPLAGCGRRDGGTVLRAADAQPADYPTVEAVRYMGQLLREKSGGRYAIDLYPGGQLGSETDTLEITLVGGLDLCRINAAPLNPMAPLTVVPCLPFLFRSEDHMRAALDGAPGRTILNSLSDAGFVGLCFYDSGARSIYLSQEAVRRPEDLRGKKVRVQNSDLYVAMLQALGADAIVMQYGEVYQSLVQRVIDGAENNWPSYESARHFEAAPNYSLTQHVMAPEVLLMSQRSWRNLDPSAQELVRECAAESVPYMRRLWDERVASAKANLADEGIEGVEVDDVEDFSRLMRPVWDRFASSPEQKRLIARIEAMAEG